MVCEQKTEYHASYKQNPGQDAGDHGVDYRFRAGSENAERRRHSWSGSKMTACLSFLDFTICAKRCQRRAAIPAGLDPASARRPLFPPGPREDCFARGASMFFDTPEGVRRDRDAGGFAASTSSALPGF